MTEHAQRIITSGRLINFDEDQPGADAWRSPGGLLQLWQILRYLLFRIEQTAANQDAGDGSGD